ncbi:MAG TPA: ComEC/Rec2 family competence protein, partial [Verrucomicrobiae bacterium]
MNRPLASLAGAYIAGILLARQWPLPHGLLAGITFGALAWAWAAPRTRRLAIPLLFLGLGTWNFTTRTEISDPQDLRRLVADQTWQVTLQGRLHTTPKLKIREQNGQETWRTAALLEVISFEHNGTNHAAAGLVLATVPEILDTNYFAGQTVKVAGRLSRPPPALAEGLFDLRAYLENRGVYYELRTDAVAAWSLLPPTLTQPPLTDRFLTWAKATLAQGLPAEDETVKLLWAMTLGWRAAFTPEISEPFLQAGTLHLFAIDGLRIALLSGILITLFRAFRLARAWCGALAIPLIWFYTAATGWDPPAIRASIMMTIIIGGWALERPGNSLNSLAAAALVILLWEPRQLFETSFQLTFGVMVIILVMVPWLDDYFKRWLQPDPMLPENLVPRWRQRLNRITLHFLQYAGLSLAAWVGSIPLSAYYFHLFSLVSIPANLLAVPTGTLALMANLGALICGQWLPWFTELFNHAAWFFMLATQWLSITAANLPAAYVYLPAPPLWSVIAYYVLIGAWLGGWFHSLLRKCLGWGTVSVCLAIGLAQYSTYRQETRITLLPLGGGQAIWVDIPQPHDQWLINCGNEAAASHTVKDFLHAQGVNRLPQVLLTEANTRSMGGITNLAGIFPIDTVYASDIHYRSQPYLNALFYFAERNRLTILNAPVTNGNWHIWHIPAECQSRPSAETTPLMVRGEFNGIRLLYLSDLNREGQKHLLLENRDLAADILVTGLPEKGEALSDDILSAVHPHVIIMMDAAFPPERAVSDRLKKRLDAMGVPVFYT